MILGDLGAEVIKVEPVTGDGMRMVEPAVLRLLSVASATSASTSRRERGKEIALSSSSGPTSSTTT